ncbi:MAG: mono/diheme cytochrome c family protein [Parasphingorhabdus sp.]|jgi:mono/diheme cytochrome c family protein
MDGTAQIGGNMPPFKDKLSETEALQIIYWLTSLWPDELFKAWKQQN